ncbi:hypothetical protein DPEC_G00330650 [Dallia pectoralis]|uniref:Uncharacterized protein n=1 Tax=Dallia pectoralis TaxID=75939 RepID=A0ACC2F914_DALPE|nr:hypothetical protein DPEC_G00330650 [Dallia pectoralis]
MAEDGGDLPGEPGARDAEGSASLPSTFIRLNDLSGAGGEGAERGEEETVSPVPDEAAAAAAGEENSASGDEEELPHPTLAPVVFFYLKQSTPPRSWCLKMVCNPYPFT